MLGLLGLVAFAAGGMVAVRSVHPALRALPPWSTPAADPALAGRFEERLGAAVVEARAGDGRYRLETPVGELNAFLRRSLADAGPLQVAVEGDRLAVRRLVEAPGGPYRVVLRGRVRLDGADWRVEEASGSAGRLGLWSPVAERLLRRAAPAAVGSIFPGRVERFGVEGETVVVEGRFEEGA